MPLRQSNNNHQQLKLKRKKRKMNPSKQFKWSLHTNSSLSKFHRHLLNQMKCLVIRKGSFFSPEPITEEKKVTKKKKQEIVETVTIETTSKPIVINLAEELKETRTINEVPKFIPDEKQEETMSSISLRRPSEQKLEGESKAEFKVRFK